MAETTAAADSSTVGHGRQAAVVESVSAADTANAGQAYTGEVVEVVSAADSCAASVIYATAVEETVTAADVAAAVCTFSAAALEAVAANDECASGNGYSVSVEESTAAAEQQAADLVIDAGDGVAVRLAVTDIWVREDDSTAVSVVAGSQDVTARLQETTVFVYAPPTGTVVTQGDETELFRRVA